MDYLSEINILRTTIAVTPGLVQYTAVGWAIVMPSPLTEPCDNH